MNADHYRTSMKQIIDSTDNEFLLRHWEKQLQWDINNLKKIDLSNEEWHLVEEGIAEYKNGNVMSLEEFINKR